MSFFSNFFKRRPKVEEIVQKVEEKIESRFVAFETRIQNMLINAFPSKEVQKEEANAFSLKAVMVNDTIKVFINNGAYYEGKGDKDIFAQVLKAQSEKEVITLILPDFYKEQERRDKEAAEVLRKEQEEAERAARQKEAEAAQREIDEKRWEYCAQLIEVTGEFEQVGDTIQMVGIPLSIPQVLVDEFVKLIKSIYDDKDITEDLSEEYDAKYEALKNFWRWCSLNPNPQARQDLFKFLQNHDLRVNRNGFFFTYRRVEESDNFTNTKEDKELTDFVNAEYLKVKTKWKKNTANFDVVQTTEGEYKTIAKDKNTGEDFPIGNLKELYEKQAIEPTVVYTDARTRSMEIVIGKEVRMPREHCDGNRNQDCSSGLHSGNKSFGFNGFGGVKILCLINPMDVVSVPAYDSNKMRSCAYLPVATLNHLPEATFLESAEVLELADEYMADQIGRLEELVAEAEKGAKIKEVAKNVLVVNKYPTTGDITEELAVTPIAVAAVDNLVNQAQVVKDTLKKRTVKI